VAPHFYTSDEELEQTVEEICRIMGDYDPHRKAR
jgi:hypothetical protein